MLPTKEDIKTEFKSCTNAISHSVYETVCSFLNHSGGTIYLGVNDDGIIEGVNEAQAETLKKNLITSFNNKNLFVPVPYIMPDIQRIDGKTIIVINVQPGQYAYSYKKRFWDRNGDADIDITEQSELLLNLFERKNPHIFEERFVEGLTLEHLDTDTFKYCRNLVRVKNPNHIWLQMSDEDLLLTCRLAERRNQKLQIRYAALLIFGTDEAIETFLPRYRYEALYHLCTWQQFERNEFTDNRYDDRKTLRCNLIKVYGELQKFVAMHLPDKFYLPSGSARREDVRGALMRELIGNICVHTDYSLGFACFFEIFKDRVVTKNVTRLVPTMNEGTVNIQELGNYTKNPLIVKVFREFDWVEDLGSGTRNILKYAPIYYKDYQIIIENGQHFSFSITYADPDTNSNTDTNTNTDTDTNTDTNPVTDPVTNTDTNTVTNTDTLSDKQRSVLALCVEPKNAHEILEQLGITYHSKNLKTYIKDLVSYGYLQMTVPDTPKNPAQKYFTTEKGKSQIK